MYNNLLAITHLKIYFRGHILPNFCAETEKESEVVGTSKQIIPKNFIFNMVKSVAKGTLLVLISCAPLITKTRCLRYLKL